MNSGAGDDRTDKVGEDATMTTDALLSGSSRMEDNNGDFHPATHPPSVPPVGHGPWILVNRSRRKSKGPSSANLGSDTRKFGNYNESWEDFLESIQVDTN